MDTPGGRIHVQWDPGANATPNTRLTFFAEFLATTGVYGVWVSSCPLNCSSPNAHSKRGVLGTWLLAILAGHNRYAHVTGLRGDAVSPQILGMEKIISEDALRRSLSRMKVEQSQAWLAPQLPGQRASRPEHPLDFGYRHHHQNFVSQTKRRSGQLQPAQTRSPQPRAAHLLGQQ